MVMMLSVGENVSEDDDNALRSQLANTEISLTLSNKHELPDTDDSHAAASRLLLRSVTLSLSLSLSVSVCLCLIMPPPSRAEALSDAFG